MLEEVKDSDFVENYGDGIDVDNTKFEDYIPEEKIKVYPYRTIGKIEEYNLIGANTTSIVRISQNNLESFSNLKTDANGDKYFEILSAVNETTGLTHGSGGSTFTQTFSKTKAFSAIANTKILNDSSHPNFFTINKSFNKADYEKQTDDKQRVFFGDSVGFGKNVTALQLLSADDQNFIEKENYRGYSAIDFVDVVTVYSNVEFSSMLFSLNENLGQNPTLDDGKSGITINTESHTMIHSIKAKGQTTGDSLHDNIDFKVREKLVPVKASIRNFDNKLTFGFDWFDYDVVMPFYAANLFVKDAPISKWVEDIDDRHLIEDIIMLCVGYAQTWKDAPRYTLQETEDDKRLSRSDVGRIRSDFYVGHTLIPVASIVNKKIDEVVDGMYRNHIVKHRFIDSTPRQQRFKSFLASISPFIYSQLAIGKGGNNFSEAYLPWFLEVSPNTQIDINTNKQTISGIETYLLPGAEYKNSVETKETAVRFVVKSQYFREEFSDSIKIKPTSELLLPKDMNISNQIDVQTDRKLELPTLPSVIKPINKLPSPGDLSTNSSKDLQYMFYLPIIEKKWKTFYINGIEEQIVPLKKGDSFDLYPPTGNAANNRTKDGVVLPTKIPGTTLSPFSFKNSLETILALASQNNIAEDFQINNEKFLKEFNSIKNENDVINYLNNIKNMLILNLNINNGLGYDLNKEDITINTKIAWVWSSQVFPVNTKWKTQSSSDIVGSPYIIFGKQEINITDYFYPILEKKSKLSNDDLKNILIDNIGMDKLGIKIISNNIEVFSQGQATFYTGIKGSAQVQLAHLEFTPATVKIKKDINQTVQTFEARQVTYDKNQWRSFIQNHQFTNGSEVTYTLDSDNIINQISEIEISSIMADSFTVNIGDSINDVFNIKAINRIDESIGIQKIMII